MRLAERLKGALRLDKTMSAPSVKLDVLRAGIVLMPGSMAMHDMTIRPTVALVLYKKMRGEAWRVCATCFCNSFVTGVWYYRLKMQTHVIF